ncbi:MAG: response regulator [Phycisphaerales bacterium]
MTDRRIILVEDERDLGELVAYNLRRAGYIPTVITDGLSGLAAIRSTSPDLVILDLMLPGMTGTEIARSLRADPSTATIPIVMLTARAEEADQISGLAIGADDYITKPFSMKLLLARIDALLRRAAAPPAGSGAILRFGPIEADLSSHRLSSEGQDLKLTLTEFKLLVAMLQAPNRVLSRNDLISRVMGPGIIVTARTIDVHIAAIRKKLGDAGNHIRTIRGVGYQLSADADARVEV